MDSLQLVLFTNSLDISDKLKLAQEVQAFNKVKLDGEPIVLPLPQDAPLEIPRIMLKNKTGNINVNIAPSRTDIFLLDNPATQQGIQNNDLDKIGEEAIPIGIDVFNVITNKYSANVHRSAIVVKLIVELDMDSKDFLQKTLFVKRKDSPHEMKAGLLFKTVIASKFKVNKWINFESLRGKVDPTKATALSFSVDINSQPEVDYKFNNITLTAYFSEAYKEILSAIKYHIG